MEIIFFIKLPCMFIMSIKRYILWPPFDICIYNYIYIQISYLPLNIHIEVPRKERIHVKYEKLK